LFPWFHLDGQANCIQVTQAAYDKLRDEYEFEERGVVDIKGQGKMTTFWLLNQKST